MVAKKSKEYSSASRCNPQLTVCCYARVRDKAFFETHEFYRIDIQILRELGYHIVVTNSVIKMLMTRCDLYYAWWFGYGIFAALLGTIMRKPVIVSGVIHTPRCGGLSDWPVLKRAVFKLTMRLADCSILCSHGEYQRLEGFRPRKCEIVPLTIDSNEYCYKQETREKTILMVTHMSLENVKRKMVLPAIKAFAAFRVKHPEFRLIVCGATGDGMDVVRACMRETGQDEWVTFTGRVSLKDKIALLQTAWAYLQPTSCEGFGLAIGEALACGTPVVTSPELCVVGTYGNAVHYGESPAEFAQCLTRLVDDADLYKIMQHRGLLQIQKYSLANRREHLKNIIDHSFA